jgi:GAF domain-containing protein
MLPDFRIHQRDYLLEISRIITQELNLELVLERIIKISVEMLAGQAGFIALRNIEQGWYIATSYGLPNQVLKYIQILLSHIHHHPTDAINNELPLVYQLVQTITDSASAGLMNSVGLPLIVYEKLIGVIVIFRSYSASFSANDRILLQTFADQAAVAVNNAQLYTQVIQEKKRIDALLDTVADGILILTKNQLIERCNPALERMLGLSQKKIINYPHEQIIKWKIIRHGISLK